MLYMFTKQLPYIKAVYGRLQFSSKLYLYIVYSDYLPVDGHMVRLYVESRES